MARTLVWFRGKDLRVADHAPLTAAIADGEVVPLFVLDPYFFAPERARKIPNRIQFLLDSLVVLAASIEKLGSRLLVVKGKSIEVVPELARKLRVDRVVAQRWVEPFARERDRRVAEALEVPFDLFEGETLIPPGTLRTGAGGPFSVFTPFQRAFMRTLSNIDPLPRPRKLPALPGDVKVKEVAIPSVESLGIERNDRVLAGGEAEGKKRLTHFLRDAVDDYEAERNRLDHQGTSRLSVDLKFGTVSPRTVWSAALAAGQTRNGVKKFLSEVVWREFSHTTLFDRPHLLKKPFRPEFETFPWRYDARLWNAWVEGKTGYPVVDASARQLLGEGYVHNRARMISASFLTKDLGISFRKGEAHYLDLLTDGDWAQNDLGWQWSAGCGCDAQPWFRVFHPVTQGEKFDPDGDYVRRWVPELARMPAKHIHSPWAAPAEVLAEAGVVLGRDYPMPVVDHAVARQRFLALAKEHLPKARQSAQGEAKRRR